MDAFGELSVWAGERATGGPVGRRKRGRRVTAVPWTRVVNEGPHVPRAGGAAHPADGLATLTEWMPGNWNGKSRQVFPASGLTKSWPVVVPT